MSQALEVVNKFYDLTNYRRQVEGMEDLIANDMRFWGPLQTVSNATDYIALNRQLLQFHSGVRMFIQIEDGDSVCSIYELMIKSPSGELLTLPMSDWIRVSGGRIVEQRIYYDPREFSRAFGLS